MGDTSIEWTRNADGVAGKTWNPIRARRIGDDERGWYCERVSEGCRNCYAERMNTNTYFGNGEPYRPASLPKLELFLDEKILQQPLHWREPRNIFPCSMTDLFGRWVNEEWIDRIFAIMRLAPWHTFQVLTKRPERMRDYLADERFRDARLGPLVVASPYWPGSSTAWPIPNVWLGVSVEDQKTADERIPLLLQTPAAVRWISAEPLVGPVDLSRYLSRAWTLRGHDHPTEKTTGVDWVVCGGESGPKARPMHPDWARSLRDQCVAADVPFFFKQHGEWIGADQQMADGGDPVLSKCDVTHKWPNGKPPGPPHFGMNYNVKVGKKAAGRLLDGREWSEYPKAKAVAA